MSYTAKDEPRHCVTCDAAWSTTEAEEYSWDGICDDCANCTDHCQGRTCPTCGDFFHGEIDEHEVESERCA